MFWIIGGEHVAKALEPLSDGPVLSAVTTQLQHAEWEGFRFFDGIFPLHRSWSPYIEEEVDWIKEGF